MTNSTYNTPEYPQETTEAFKKAAQTVSQELGLNFVQEAKKDTSENNTGSDLQSSMREQMLAQGISPGAIAEAEKFAQLRKEFIKEAHKLRSQSVSEPIVATISSEEVDKHYKQAEDAVAEMLLLRKQAQQPSNTATEKKKPD